MITKFDNGLWTVQSIEQANLSRLSPNKADRSWEDKLLRAGKTKPCCQCYITLLLSSKSTSNWTLIHTSSSLISSLSTSAFSSSSGGASFFSSLGFFLRRNRQAHQPIKPKRPITTTAKIANIILKKKKNHLLCFYPEEIYPVDFLVFVLPNGEIWRENSGTVDWKTNINVGKVWEGRKKNNSSLQFFTISLAQFFNRDCFAVCDSFLALLSQEDLPLHPLKILLVRQSTGKGSFGKDLET